MFLHFIFSNVSLISTGIWIVFFILALIRFVRPKWVGTVSINTLIIIAVSIHLAYGAFVTWGQYYVWATASDVSRVFISSPLPIEAPLPAYLEWVRPLFQHQLGYFVYHMFLHTWLSIISLFMVAGVLYAFFRLVSLRRDVFLQDGPKFLLVLMLIAGMPGIVLLLPLGLILALVILGLLYVLKKSTVVRIEHAFFIATPFALLLGHYLLNSVFKLLIF